MARKIQLVKDALEELGLTDGIDRLTPNEIASGLRRFDQMVAAWEEENITLGVPLSDDPNGGDPDQDVGIPVGAMEAVRTNLAIRLAPTFGIPPSPELKQIAKEAYDRLLRKGDAQVPSLRVDGNFIARGQGNRRQGSVNNPFYPSQRRVEAETTPSRGVLNPTGEA